MARMNISTVAYYLFLFCKCCALYSNVSPLSLTLRYKRVEISSRTINIRAGRTLEITCDASRADKPLLRWYGKRGRWIENEGKQNRIHIEHPINNGPYKRFQKLVIQNIRPSDSGRYTCRGVLADSFSHETKYVNIEVHAPSTTQLKRTEPTLPAPSSSVKLQTKKTTPTTTETKPTTTETTTTTTKTTTTTTQSTTTEVEKLTTTPSTTITTTPSKTITTSPTTLSTTTPSTTPYKYIYTDYPYGTTESDECYPPDHKCGDGFCVLAAAVCDSLPDCVDGSDELNCSVSSCSEGQIICTDKSGCVNPSEVCDGYPHCKDYSDEDPAFCSA